MRSRAIRLNIRILQEKPESPQYVSIEGNRKQIYAYRSLRLRVEMPVLLLLLLTVSACRETASASGGQQKPSTKDSNIEKCLAEARDVLGPEAEVLKCGRLTDAAGLETVAAIRHQHFQSGEGIPVSKLVILRESALRWQVELNVDKWITNHSGYLGIEFIDDSAEHVGYRVNFSDHRSDDAPGFTVQLRYLHRNGASEWPIEISWNPAVKRFQTYAYDEDPPRFESEVKNPPHKNIRN